MSLSSCGNRVTDDGPYTYAYDEEGNIVRRTDPDGNERQLIYDYRNRLTEVKDYTGTHLSFPAPSARRG